MKETELQRQRLLKVKEFHGGWSPRVYSLSAYTAHLSKVVTLLLRPVFVWNMKLHSQYDLLVVLTRHHFQLSTNYYVMYHASLHLNLVRKCSLTGHAVFKAVHEFQCRKVGKTNLVYLHKQNTVGCSPLPNIQLPTPGQQRHVIFSQAFIVKNVWCNTMEFCKDIHCSHMTHLAIPLLFLYTHLNYKIWYRCLLQYEL